MFCCLAVEDRPPTVVRPLGPERSSTPRRRGRLSREAQSGAEAASHCSGAPSLPEGSRPRSSPPGAADSAGVWPSNQLNSLSHASLTQERHCSGYEGPLPPRFLLTSPSSQDRAPPPTTAIERHVVLFVRDEGVRSQRFSRRGLRIRRRPPPPQARGP